MFLLEIALAAALVVWCALGIFHLWNLQGAILLTPAGEHLLAGAEQAQEGGGAAVPPFPLPKVSIIVAARNEQETLPAALSSLLKLDYPDYEVILVDDDSTDSTGPIADEWAARPESSGRLRVIHNHELPPGWRGKVYALDLAAQAASGEWLLAMDADVVFHPAVLLLALATALRRNAQFFSMAPEFEYSTFWGKAVLPAFSFLLGTLYPLRLVNHPSSRPAIAAGAFILMRRKDFEELGGYRRLRGTLIEDLRMAQLFKSSGRRIYVVLSRGLFRTRMYTSAGDLWEGLSRSAFEGAGSSVASILAGVLGGILLSALPSASVLGLLLSDLALGRSHAPGLALVLALTGCAVSAAVYLPALILLRVSPLYVFTLPLATLFYSGVALDSALTSIFGGGVSWKGRRYKPDA